MANHPRRAFLGHLARLPLIGGGIALIGKPTAAAVPPTPEIIETYKTWLDMEMRWLAWEAAGDPFFKARYAMRGDESRMETADTFKSVISLQNPASSFHPDAGNPSTRAAIVLSAVGCGWKEN